MAIQKPRFVGDVAISRIERPALNPNIIQAPEGVGAAQAIFAEGVQDFAELGIKFSIEQKAKQNDALANEADKKIRDFKFNLLHDRATGYDKTNGAAAVEGAPGVSQSLQDEFDRMREGMAGGDGPDPAVRGPAEAGRAADEAA